MAEAYPPPGSVYDAPKRKSNTGMIIGITLLVLLLCCCALVLLFYFVLGDPLLDWLQNEGILEFNLLKSYLPV